MKRALAVVLGLGLAFAVGFGQTPEVLEAKLDDLAAKLTVLHYGTDVYGKYVQWLPTIYLDVQEIKAFRFEFGEFQTEIVAALNKLESKLDALSAQLATHDKEIKDAIASAKSDILGAIASAKTDILTAISTHDTAIKNLLNTGFAYFVGRLNAVDAALAAIEDKLDTEESFVDDAELAAHETAVLGAIDTAKTDIITAIGDAKTAILTAISTHDTAIKNLLNTGFAYFVGRLNAVDAALEAIEGKLDDLVIPDYSDELASIEDKLDAIEGKLDSETTGLSAIVSVLNAIEGKLDDLVIPDYSDELASIEGKLDDSIYGLSAIRSAIDNMAGGLTLKDLYSILEMIYKMLSQIYDGAQCVKMCP